MRRTYIRRFFACAMLAVVIFMILPTRIHADDALENKISKIVASIPEAYQSDAMKALYLHDYVVDHVVYGQSANDQTAYGALIEGKAVCAGYTDAYQKLLTAAGIESTFISGLADNGSGAPQAHAWIMVKLEGKCYFTDVTWDDPFVNGVQEKRHNYFNLSLEQMSVDHFPYDRYADVLPDSCNHTDLDYYSLCTAKGAGVGIFDDSTTAAEAAKYFAQVSNGKFTCDFRFDGTNLDAWIDDNWADIAYVLGLSGYISASISPSSNSCVLTVFGTDTTDDTQKPATEATQPPKETQKPTEATKPPKETEKPTEATKPPKQTDPPEETKPTETTKPTQKPTEQTEVPTQPATKPTQPSKPTETTRPAQTEPQKEEPTQATSAPATQPTTAPADSFPAETETTQPLTTGQEETGSQSVPDTSGDTQTATDLNTTADTTSSLSVTTQHLETEPDQTQKGGAGKTAIAVSCAIAAGAGAILGFGYYRKKKT